MYVCMYRSTVIIKMCRYMSAHLKLWPHCPPPRSKILEPPPLHKLGKYSVRTLKVSVLLLGVGDL